MDDAARSLAAHPESQRRLWARCVHPAGSFRVFPGEDLEGSVPARFERQVELHGARLAIKIGREAWTYETLNALANRIAWTLLDSADAPGAPVAGLFEPGAEAIAAMLGALKAGQTYVPLDPTHPGTRLGLIAASARPTVLLTTARLVGLAGSLQPAAKRLLAVDRLPGSAPARSPGRPVPPDALACLIYTSGSTGRPKGVMHTHRTLLHMTMTQTNYLHLCPDDRLSLLYSPSVIGGVRSLFLALLNGASLFPRHLPETGITGLAAWLEEEGITFYRSVPVVFRQLMASLTGGERFPALRWVRVGGDVVEAEDVALYRQRLPDHCVFVAGYGSTETGIVLQHLIDKATPVGERGVSLGYPIDEARVAVLGDDGAEVEDGQVGELVVQSRYLALGYWEDPALTRERFGEERGDGSPRTYRTADMGRRRPDGSVEHRGRKASHAKIRGYRVDPGEVEHALRAMPAVADVVVVPWDEPGGDTRLAAYVVATPPPPTAAAVRDFLLARLPAYMVPASIVLLDALPRTPTNKVDRAALPAPGPPSPGPAAFVAPRTPVEARLATLWSAVLGLERIGVHDQFLDLGGDSLRAMQIANRVREAWPVEIPLPTLFEAGTVAEMAGLVDRYLAGEEPLPP